MEIKKYRLCIWISGLIFFLVNIFTLIFTVWMTKALLILFYISFCLISIFYIYFGTFLHFEISLNINCLKTLGEKLKKRKMFALLIFGILAVFQFIILFVDVVKFLKFWKNCPFFLDDLDYSLHLNRRCQLYDINNNTRYSYQYICSYDPTKDFASASTKEKLKEEIKPESITCIEAKKLIPFYEEIKLFYKEYQKEKKYYCSRTDKPEVYSFVKNTECKKVKYSFMLVFYLFQMFQIYYAIVYLKYLLYERRVARRIYFDNFGPRIQRQRNREYMEIRNLINFGRLLNLIRDLININDVNSSICSTKATENPAHIPNINLNNEENNQRNIIVENKQEYEIKKDINNLAPDKINGLNNSINIDQIKISFDMNSEEISIKNQSHNNINNINNQ